MASLTIDVVLTFEKGRKGGRGRSYLNYQYFNHNGETPRFGGLVDHNYQDMRLGDRVRLLGHSELISGRELFIVDDVVENHGPVVDVGSEIFIPNSEIQVSRRGDNIDPTVIYSGRIVSVIGDVRRVFSMGVTASGYVPGTEGEVTARVTARDPKLHRPVLEAKILYV